MILQLKGRSICTISKNFQQSCPRLCAECCGGKIGKREAVLLRSVLWQVMLTGEPSLVSMSAALLEAMLEHNSASLATLYQTGIFFFALAYCGSNLVEIGHLFKVCVRLSESPPEL